MTARELAEAYLGARGRGDLDAMAGLFSVLELAADDRIAALHIVYDSADVRPVFENETRRPSWHADQSGH
ncbi:MAG: hypothetical protein ACRDND_11180 [Streptosporangiaceae bacterium]